MTSASQKSPPRRRTRRLGRPRDRGLRARRQEQILATATRVFAEHGYRNTDVQFVADPLRISKGTIYRYFPTKERLFIAAVERGVRQLDEVMSQACSAADPIEGLAAATRAYLQFFEENPDLVELFVQERAEFREQRVPVYFKQNCSAEGQAMLSALVATGRLRNVPVERMMNVARDLLYGTVLTNHFAGRDKSFEEQAADINDVLFNGILTESERRKRSLKAHNDGHLN